MGTTDANFECHAIFSYKSVRYIDAKIGKRNKQVLIVAANCVTAVMVFTPGLIVVPCLLAKVVMIPCKSWAFSRRTCSCTTSNRARIRSLRVAVIVPRGIVRNGGLVGARASGGKRRASDKS